MSSSPLIMIGKFVAFAALAMSVIVRPLPAQVPTATTTTSAPTTWTIVVDGTKDNSGVSYPSVTTDNKNCSYANITQDPKNLTICPGDIVEWQGKTETSGAQKHHMYVFMSGDILTDPGGNTARLFQGVDGNVTTPPGKAKNAAANFQEWFVLLFDDNHHRVHIGDPKIKIGTGSGPTLEQLLNSLQSEAEQLRQLIDDMQKHAEQVLHSLPNDADAKKLLKDIDELKKKANLN